MESPTIIWTDEGYRWVARFSDCPRDLVYVRQPITLDRWNLRICVIVPWDRATHFYMSKEKAMAHAERWLAYRHQRILDDMPKPFMPPPAPRSAVSNEDHFAPHPGGKKRVWKSRRKPF